MSASTEVTTPAGKRLAFDYEVGIAPYGPRAKYKGRISYPFNSRPVFKFRAENGFTAYSKLRALFRPEDGRELAKGHYLNIPKFYCKKVEVDRRDIFVVGVWHRLIVAALNVEDAVQAAQRHIKAYDLAPLESPAQTVVVGNYRPPDGVIGDKAVLLQWP
jgi:hypothetical protein